MKSIDMDRRDNKSNEEETRKLSVAPTATRKINNEGKPNKAVTDANFQLASDLYIDKGPTLSEENKKHQSTVKSVPQSSFKDSALSGGPTLTTTATTRPPTRTLATPRGYTSSNNLNSKNDSSSNLSSKTATSLNLKQLSDINANGSNSDSADNHDDDGENKTSSHKQNMNTKQLSGLTTASSDSNDNNNATGSSGPPRRLTKGKGSKRSGYSSTKWNSQSGMSTASSYDDDDDDDDDDSDTYASRQTSSKSFKRDPNKSPDHSFFADQNIKLSRGNTAYKVIEPENLPPDFDHSKMRTIILLHGLTDSSYIWEDMTEVLSSSVDGAHARVIIMDFYGHGRSPWGGYPCTLDVFVTQVQELLGTLNLNLGEDGVDVMGYCLGGAVAIGFSVKFPHLCKSLCLIDPAGIRLKNPARYRILRRKFVGELAMMYRKKSLVSEQHDMFYNPAYNTPFRPLVDKQQEMVQWQQKFTPGYTGALLSIFRYFPLNKMSDLFAVSGRRIERPVLFLWGNEDTLFPLRKALAIIEQAFPKADILAIMECGHNPIFEKFEDIASAIVEFYLGLGADSDS